MAEEELAVMMVLKQIHYNTSGQDFAVNIASAQQVVISIIQLLNAIN